MSETQKKCLSGFAKSAQLSPSRNFDPLKKTLKSGKLEEARHEGAENDSENEYGLLSTQF